MALSAITGKAIPLGAPSRSGGALWMRITDSQAWMHGKRVALYGDPDHVSPWHHPVPARNGGGAGIHIVVSNSNDGVRS
jgi:nitrogenase molybdenum-iron protein beta chain